MVVISITYVANDYTLAYCHIYKITNRKRQFEVEEECGLWEKFILICALYGLIRIITQITDISHRIRNDSSSNIYV